MSKILNRPMFRGGGKVSSYGNGITTGLADGYEKGGSVQPRQNLFLGGMAMSGLGYLGRGAMRYGLKPAQRALNYMFKPKDGFGLTITGGRTGSQGIKDINKAGGSLERYVNQTMPNKSLSEMGKDFASSRAGDVGKFFYKDPLVKYPLKAIGAGAKAAVGLAKKPVMAAGLGYGGYQFKDEISDIYNKYFGDGETETNLENLDDPNSEENKLKRIKKAQEDSKKEIDEIKKLYGTEEKIDSEDETLNKIAKKKAIIEKAMGGGKKAMIDDLSTMGLSFAGKALKEGATTKSAFADFFEEESKRPSRSKKLSDAASQAAIQSYLTGEIDEKKFNEKMNMFIGQTKINSLMKKAEKENLSLAEIGQSNRTSGSQSKKDEQNAQVWLDINEPGKFVNTTNSKKIPVEVLFTDENIGQFFLDENTGEFFEIVVLNDGAIGKQRKG